MPSEHRRFDSTPLTATRRPVTLGMRRGRSAESQKPHHGDTVPRRNAKPGGVVFRRSLVLLRNKFQSATPLSRVFAAVYAPCRGCADCGPFFRYPRVLSPEPRHIHLVVASVTTAKWLSQSFDSIFQSSIFLHCVTQPVMRLARVYSIYQIHAEPTLEIPCLTGLVGAVIRAFLSWSLSNLSQRTYCLSAEGFLISAD